MDHLKNNMKRVFLMALVAVLVACGQPTVAQAASTESMTIYGMYVDGENKGDAVLIKSAKEYILMDLSLYANVPLIADQLEAAGITHFKLYISHLHIDHVGGKKGDFMAGLNYLKDRGFTIDYLYVADPSLAPEATDYAAKYESLRTYMNDYMGGEDRIVYLTQGSQFTVGYATFEVLAPSLDFVNSIHPSDYSAKVKEDTEVESEAGQNVLLTYYENNCSLVTRVSCGGVSYLTAGDMLADEAAYLVKEFGTDLGADIFKLSHHGTALGNTAELLSAINPAYTFAINNTFTDFDTELKQWAVNRSMTAAKPVSMPYYVASEKKTIAYRVVDGVISLYQGETLGKLKKLKGWVGVTGADGINRTVDYYYIGDDGLPMASIQQIDGVTYCFTDGGAMEYGDYGSNGSYLGWKSYDTLKHRYFRLIEGTELAEMLTGFQTINGCLFYFDKDGWLEESLEDIGFITIEGNTYLMDDEGMLYTNELYEQDGNQYYFGEDGTMTLKQIVSIDGDSYYFGKYGTMQYNLLTKVGKNTYYFDEEGKMVTGSERTLGTKEYYFDGDGVMACKQIVALNGNSYYFGKYGTKVKGQLIKSGGNSYYFDEEGKMVTDQEYTIGTKEYYFDADGVMAVKKIVELPDGTYYYGKYGTKVKGQFVKYEGNKYYFDEEGKMVSDQEFTLGTKEYYFDADGVMAVKKIVELNGTSYYYGKNGTKVRDAIVKVGDGKYYFDENGEMATDQLVVKGEKAYYFDKNGQMVCGQLVKDKTGNLYYFGKKGTMVKSKTVKVDGVTYTFDANGIGTAQNAAA